jgi:flagellar biosynthetic protein FliR
MTSSILIPVLALDNPASVFSRVFTLPQIMSFIVVLFRVSGIMIFAPFYSNGAFPSQIRVVFPLVLAVTLAPMVPQGQFAESMDLSQGIIAVLGELLVGMIIGLTASFIFGALQLAGQIIGFQLGLSMVNVIDPQSQVENSVISILHNFIGIMLFLLMNGHHWFIQAVGDSLQYLPAGGVHLRGPLVDEMVHLSGQMFVSGFRIAGPVIAITVIADVILGMIGRAAPQINILIVGMPAKTLIGLAALSIAFYFLPTFLGESFAQLSKQIGGMVHSLR